MFCSFNVFVMSTINLMVQIRLTEFILNFNIFSILIRPLLRKVFRAFSQRYQKMWFNVLLFRKKKSEGLLFILNLPNMLMKVLVKFLLCKKEILLLDNFRFHQ